MIIPILIVSGLFGFLYLLFVFLGDLLMRKASPRARQTAFVTVTYGVAFLYLWVMFTIY